MKVYVVTYGLYSDYGIEAIFSTKEKAEEYLKNAAEIGYEQGYSELNDDILEYELDERNIDLNKKNTYSCSFDPSDGKLDVNVMLRPDAFFKDQPETGYNGDVSFYVKANTIESAKKIAREKAAMYKEAHYQDNLDTDEHND